MNAISMKTPIDFACIAPRFHSAQCAATRAFPPCRCRILVASLEFRGFGIFRNFRVEIRDVCHWCHFRFCSQKVRFIRASIGSGVVQAHLYLQHNGELRTGIRSTGLVPAGIAGNQVPVFKSCVPADGLFGTNDGICLGFRCGNDTFVQWTGSCFGLHK